MGNLPSNHEHVTTVVTKIRIYLDLSDTCFGSIFGPLAKNSTFQKFSVQEVVKAGCMDRQVGTRTRVRPQGVFIEFTTKISCVIHFNRFRFALNSIHFVSTVHRFNPQVWFQVYKLLAVETIQEFRRRSQRKHSSSELLRGINWELIWIWTTRRLRNSLSP